MIGKVCTNALNILVRFHIKGHLPDAVNETRKSDAKKLKAEGREAVLTKSKYIFLNNPENLTDDQAEKLSELLGYNLRVVRAYLMKEDFERFWEYRSVYWSGRFLDAWCNRAMRSKIYLTRGQRGRFFLCALRQNKTHRLRLRHAKKGILNP